MKETLRNESCEYLGGSVRRYVNGVRSKVAAGLQQAGGHRSVHRTKHGIPLVSANGLLELKKVLVWKDTVLV